MTTTEQEPEETKALLESRVAALTTARAAAEIALANERAERLQLEADRELAHKLWQEDEARLERAVAAREKAEAEVTRLRGSLGVAEIRLGEGVALLERWNKLSGPTCEELQQDTWEFLSRIRAEATAEPRCSCNRIVESGGHDTGCSYADQPSLRWPTAEEVTAKELAAGNFIPSAPVLCHPTDPCVHGITGPCRSCQKVCDRLGIDVPAWAEEIRAKVAAAQDHPPLRTRAELTGEERAVLETKVAALTAELAAWKQALGGAFGPQTPAEVPVFLREAERVQGHVAALEISKLKRERDTLSEAFDRAHARELELERAEANAHHSALENSVIEVARLRTGLGVESIRLGECEANVEILRHELAAERAAREQAEKRANDNLHDAAELDAKYLGEWRARVAAERERDAALARVKELEERGKHVEAEVVRICGEREEMGRRAQAAESALASAQATIAKVRAGPLWSMCQAEPETEDDEPLYTGMLIDPGGQWIRIDDLLEALSSAPSPAPERSDKRSRWNELGELPVTVMATSEYPSPAPCSGCAAARELLQKVASRKECHAAIMAWLKEHP